MDDKKHSYGYQVTAFDERGDGDISFGWNIYEDGTVIEQDLPLAGYGMDYVTADVTARTILERLTGQTLADDTNAVERMPRNEAIKQAIKGEWIRNS